jgi:hypothetical protein
MTSKNALATLGPEGTDAQAMAAKISDNVILCASFPEAMEYAQRHNGHALVACGFRQVKEGQVVDSWVDLHFRFYGKMKVIETYCEDTKPMCIAKQIECKVPKTLVIHPATQAFVHLAPWDVRVSYVDAKPEAARLTALGTYDSCIASADIVAKYPNLEIIETFKPQMVWAVYEKN